MAILHATGIHKQVGDPKKEVRKKVSTFCVPKKVRSEVSPFFPPFFNRGINRQYPNDRLLVENVHSIIWRTRLCIPAGFPRIPAGTPFLQIFFRNYVPAKHRNDRNGLSLHLAFVRRSKKRMDRPPEIP